MQKIINFYKKFNFVVPTDHGHFLTQKWIKRCSNFSKNSLTNKKLLIEKKIYLKINEKISFYLNIGISFCISIFYYFLSNWSF